MSKRKTQDQTLGLDRSITRRDFMAGTGAIVASAAACGLPEERNSSPVSPKNSSFYPPAWEGLRGSNPPSYRVAHLLARSGQKDFGTVYEDDPTLYDLVVVGGGLSGLSAAFFYREKKPDARILILENHDDFGGHARRNEFEVDGQTLIGYGGSQSLEDPHNYPRATRKLISDLGVDLSRFESAYDRDFYKRNGLQIGFHFDASLYGENKWVPYPVANPLDEDEFAPTKLSAEQATQAMPISESARRQLAGLLKPDLAKLRANRRMTEVDFLRSLTYRDFIRQHLGATSPEVDRILNAAAVSNFAGSIDQISAWGAMSWGGLPGLPLSLMDQRVEEEEWDPEPYIYHFPDGNASIARLLVRRLIPQVAPGHDMEDIVGARFNYDRLDESGSSVRLRLGSTATRVSHVGSAESAEEVQVTYVRGHRAERIRAKQCVLACYSVMIPHLCPQLPSPQKEALSSLVRAPLIYTSVALRNWRGFAEKNVGWAFCPGLDHQAAALDFPVSLGSQTYSANPNEPILVHLEGAPLQVGSGLTPRDQYRAARAKMLTTPFEDMERSIRNQLAGLLSGTEFDPARDIEGITVNRWGHGYAYGYNPLTDPADRGQSQASAPHRVGRRPFGRVTIANSDAGASASLPGAIEQAHRAVSELFA